MRPRCDGSSTRSVSSGPARSPMSALTPPIGSPRWSPSVAPTRCADAFHVVAWATDALDEVRRQAWNEARGAVDRRRAGRASGHARALKRARYALWKNPENLTHHQQHKLDWIAKTDPRLWRAYLLKEGLRTVFVLKGNAGTEALDHWILWAGAAASTHSSPCNGASSTTAPRSTPPSTAASRTR